MSYKMKGFSGFKSPLKQDDDKCYIDDKGKTVCPQSNKLLVAQKNAKFRRKKKERVYQGGELPEVKIKG